MQLIVDADNIDIERNMSTIEQEPLNEKFLTNKVIDHLTDDVTTGNKENIQKQQNIILDIGEDNNVDTDKETISGDETLKNNLSVEKLPENTVDTEDVQTPEEMTENTNIKNDENQGSDTSIIEDENKEDSLPEENEETIIKDVSETELIEKNEIGLVNLDENPDVVDTTIDEEHNGVETSTDLKEQEIQLEKQVDVSELSTELNEEKEVDSDEKVDITEVSISEPLTELNEVKDMDLDKDVDITEVSISKLSTGLNEAKEMDKDKEIDVEEISTKFSTDNNIKVDNIVDTVTENDLENESVHNEVPNKVLGDKSQVTKGTEIKLSSINDKNTAIEIDDEDDKTNEINVQSVPKVQHIIKNVDKSDDAELITEIGISTQENSISKKASEESQPKRICRLSNNLDIFSDEEDDQPNEEPPKDNTPPLTDKQCINIDDDDDIMLIDEDSNVKDSKIKECNIEVDMNAVSNNIKPVSETINQPKDEINACLENKEMIETVEETVSSVTENKDIIAPTNEISDNSGAETNKVTADKPEETEKIKKPLLPKNFLNTCKKNLSDMTRNDLEEFCILKIVESIVDRSNLGEIKAHLKNLTQTMEECKKKCLMLTKQNKDLQVVLKSVQEEQKSGSDVHITPLKITRSVGMQVVMVADKSNLRKKPINGVGAQPLVPNNNCKQTRIQQIQNPRNQKEKIPTVNQQIPVPRLVPATPPAVKTNSPNANTTATKQVVNNALPNGIRNSPPVQKIPEKRARSQAVTVDLTDDEPPPKLQNVQRGPISQPMRVLTTGPNLIPGPRFNQNMNSPRKVYIPISGPQAQNVRPGQTIMLKTLSGIAPRPRAPAQALITKSPQTASPVRFRGQPNRHPAPLPDAVKQYQSPNWKMLPPAPDLKLSKVENGIVISWKIDGYQEENHEEIASYQLYAYQETSSPPNTALWKKIGDVKALPLPMACTLTQFMAGYKYYFAVRAVDIRSRFGPFSLPGSILLLNKM